MKSAVILTVIAAMLLAGCQQVVVPDEPKACTADAMMCPDGSAVGRDPNNNCEFPACPQVQGCTKDLKVCDDGTTVSRDANNNCEFSPCPTIRYVSNSSAQCEAIRFTCEDGEEPFFDDSGCGCRTAGAFEENNENSGGLGMQLDRRYVERDPETCKLVDFVCIEGAKPFFDETGCGCEPIQLLDYKGNSTEHCASIKFACQNNTEYFSDETGCGCMFNWGGTLPEEELVKTFCEPSQRSSICTMQYEPVCGWFNQEVQCIRYPCAATYDNACSACSDPKVEHHTPGECPQ